MISFFTKKILICFFILSMIVPATLLALPPKPVQADSTSCIASFLIGVAISAAAAVVGTVISVPAVDNAKTYAAGLMAAGNNKSFIMDCIIHPLALAIGKYLLTEITNEIVKWINSGFKGNPAFVTDPETLFSNMANELAGQMILGSDLGFLCSPFQVQVKLALALNFSYNYNSSYQHRSSCTLTQIVGNINNFTNDPFGKNTRGWAGWFSLTQNTNNNVMGSYLNANAQLDARVIKAHVDLSTQLNWGQGFLSQTKCTVGTPPENVTVTSAVAPGSTYDLYPGDAKKNSYDKCETVTPGKIIGDKLSGTLGSDVDQLKVADDIDKILSALGNQLFQTVLGGIGGLLGSTNSNYGSVKTLDQLLATASSSQAKAQGQAKAGSKLGIMNNPSNKNRGLQPAPEQDVARGAVAQESCPNWGQGGFPASKITDGDRTNDGGSSTGGSIYSGAIAFVGAACSKGQDPTYSWMSVALPSPTMINEIRIWQRPDPNLQDSGIQGSQGNNGTPDLTFHVTIEDKSGNVLWTSAQLTQDWKTYPIDLIAPTDIPEGTTGQIVRLDADTSTYPAERSALEIAEIEVYPNSPPVINLNGDNPLQTDVGVPITWPDPISTFGAVGTDLEEGDISPNIKVNNPVDINTPGSYNVTYTVQDSSGQTATSTRVVIVSTPIAATLPHMNLVSAATVANSQAITLTYDQQLDTTSKPDPQTDFKVTVNGQKAPIGSISISGSTVVINTIQALPAKDPATGFASTITVSYTSNQYGSSLQSTTGDQALDITSQRVTIN